MQRPARASEQPRVAFHKKLETMAEELDLPEKTFKTISEEEMTAMMKWW